MLYALCTLRIPYNILLRVFPSILHNILNTQTNISDGKRARHIPYYTIFCVTYIIIYIWFAGVVTCLTLIYGGSDYLAPFKLSSLHSSQLRDVVSIEARKFSKNWQTCLSYSRCQYARKCRKKPTKMLLEMSTSWCAMVNFIIQRVSYLYLYTSKSFRN